MTIRTTRSARVRRTPGLLAALLFLSLPPATLVSTPAYAESGSEDPTTAAARARFKEGVEFYDKGQFEQARAAFLQAYALKKHPAVLLNLAWSCLKGGHALEAERYFKQFLSEGKEITEKQRTDANEGLTQAHTKLGRIEIMAPTGTEVTIDGERVGTAPISDLISVEAGAHTVKFKGADASVETESVSVMGGEKVVAKFTKTAPAVVPAPPPAPPPPAQPEATSSPPPPVSKSSDEGASPIDNSGPHEKEAPVSTHHGPGLFAPPRNVAPVIVLGVLAVGAGVTAGLTGVYFKNQAQDNANQTAASIESNAPPGQAQGVCNHPPTSGFASACSLYTQDNNDVNTDATIGNFALGGAIAFGAGALLYWMFADKEYESTAAAAPKPVVTPVVGRGFGGLSIGGQF